MQKAKNMQIMIDIREDGRAEGEGGTAGNLGIGATPASPTAAVSSNASKRGRQGKARTAAASVERQAADKCS